MFDRDAKISALFFNFLQGTLPANLLTAIITLYLDKTFLARLILQ